MLWYGRNLKLSERQTKAGNLELSRTLFSRTLTLSRWSLGHDMRKPLPLQCTGWLRKLESRREMLDGASVARLQWDKHLPETAIYRSSDLQSMMFVPFSKDFCGDQYLYLLFIPTLVKILRSHCSLLPTTSSKSGFFLTPAMLTNTTSYLLKMKMIMLKTIELKNLWRGWQFI